MHKHYISYASYIQCSALKCVQMSTPPLKNNILNNISMNKNIFQNVDKTKFYITSV